MQGQPKTDLTRLTRADSGVRPEPPRLVAVHTTENGAYTPVENVAEWQQDVSNGSSYHILIGTDGRTCRSNDDEYMPWAAMPTGNRIALHVSLIGRASFTREQWLKYPSQLDALARIIFEWTQLHGIPARWLTAEQVRAGKWGLCGHAEISRAFRESDHMDPGPGLPRDLILEKVQKMADSKTPAPTPAPKERATVDLVLDQLAGYPGREFKGWEQLGGRTVVDALAAIGEKLGVDGMKER